MIIERTQQLTKDMKHTPTKLQYISSTGSNRTQQKFITGNS